MIELSIIGYVHSLFDEPQSPGIIKKQPSVISVFPEFEDGLWKLKESRYLEIIYLFHLSDHFKLHTNTFTGEIKGVFASRNPKRPSKTGISVVELDEICGCEVKVRGLDAINGSPVLDIKPYYPKLSIETEQEVHESNCNFNPRMLIMPLVWSKQIIKLLKFAAQLHGHYCPLLSLGVMMSVRAFDEMKARNWLPAECTGKVSNEGGIIDGVQSTLGMTVGNGRLKVEIDAHLSLKIHLSESAYFSICVNQEYFSQIIDLQPTDFSDCKRISETINFNVQSGAQLKHNLLNQSLSLSAINIEKLLNVNSPKLIKDEKNL